MLVGGVLIKKCNWGVKGILKFCATGVFIGVLAYLGFLLRCKTPDFHGIDYQLDGYHQNLTKPCNAHCQCQQNKFMFLPTCANNTNYYSPCFAGCTEKESLPDGVEPYR